VLRSQAVRALVDPALVRVLPRRRERLDRRDDGFRGRRRLTSNRRIVAEADSAAAA
jgi:hypothetical protein